MTLLEVILSGAIVGLCVAWAMWLRAVRRELDARNKRLNAMEAKLLDAMDQVDMLDQAPEGMQAVALESVLAELEGIRRRILVEIAISTHDWDVEGGL